MYSEIRVIMMKIDTNASSTCDLQCNIKANRKNETSSFGRE